jgi:hypothetical protein
MMAGRLAVSAFPAVNIFAGLEIRTSQVLVGPHGGVNIEIVVS